MKNLRVKRFAILIFIVFVLSFAGFALVRGKAYLGLWEIFVISYKTIPVILLVICVFVGFGWRCRIFHSWLVPFPDLNGTWHGNIQTTWRNPETNEVPPPIPVTLSIKQSFIHISCVMRTAEMTSRSYLAGFWLDHDDQIRMLGYSYHSSPMLSVRSRSQPHDGTIIFELIGSPVEKLKGRYWTERQTTGEIDLKFREKKRLEEFPEDLGSHPMSSKC